MSGAIFTTVMDSTGPFALMTINDGVFSPASPIQPFVPQQVFPFGVERAAVRVEDMYINSYDGADPPMPLVHSMEIWYRPRAVTALPETPVNGPNNYTLIYAYTGRSNVNPFHEDDGSTPPRRLKKLVFGSQNPVTPIIPFGGQGTLQFVVGAGFTGRIFVTIHWSLINPGGGVGT